MKVLLYILIGFLGISQMAWSMEHNNETDTQQSGTIVLNAQASNALMRQLDGMSRVNKALNDMDNTAQLLSNGIAKFKKQQEENQKAAEHWKIAKACMQGVAGGLAFTGLLVLLTKLGYLD